MTYRDTLEKIRLAFPQPVSDSIHDSYFVHSIMRALDQVDALKTHLPMLGDVAPGDFEKAKGAALPDGMSSVEDVTAELVEYLRGMTIFGHPRTQQNVIPPPTIPSLIGVLLASLHNPNISWDEYSRLVALAEVEVVAMTSKLIGYDPEVSSGVFTFGGTGTTLYGVKLGLEKACAGTMQKGTPEELVVFVSDAGHYCASNIVGWLGIGTNNLITIPTTVENEIDLTQLEQQARTALGDGKKIAAIIATLGTTDSFGLDDLESIAALRDALVEEFQLDYNPHIHADAVIGWAWSVFNDYDIEKNSLGFRPAHRPCIGGSLSANTAFISGRFGWNRLPQDWFCTLYFQPCSRQESSGFGVGDSTAGTDALPLPLWRLPSPECSRLRLLEQGRDRLRLSPISDCSAKRVCA